MIPTRFPFESLRTTKKNRKKRKGRRSSWQPTGPTGRQKTKAGCHGDRSRRRHTPDAKNRAESGDGGNEMRPKPEQKEKKDEKKEREREREREREYSHANLHGGRQRACFVFRFLVDVIGRRGHAHPTHKHTHTPRTEENDWLRSHPVSAFGCVVCNDNNNNIHHETKREDEGEKRPMRRTETADSLGFSSFLIGAALSPPEAPPEAPPDLPGLQTTMLSRPSDFFSTEAA